MIGSVTVQVVRAPLVTDPRYGSSSRDWNDAVTIELRGCAVLPGGNTEDPAFREATAGRLKLYANEYTTEQAGLTGGIEAEDRVIYEGVTYEVVGDSARYRDGQGRRRHSETVLSRMEG